jgi:hypothetical protein
MFGMKTITKNDYTTVGDFTLSAFASDLGLKPGEFPAAPFIDGFGTFALDYVTKDGSHVYRRGASKFTFTIFND